MGEDYIQKNRYTAVYTGLRAAAWTLSRTSPGLSFDGTGISSKTRALDIMVVRYRNKRRILTKVYAVRRVRYSFKFKFKLLSRTFSGHVNAVSVSNMADKIPAIYWYDTDADNLECRVKCTIEQIKS